MKYRDAQWRRGSRHRRRRGGWEMGRGYPPPQPTKGLGQHRELPQLGWGAEPWPKVILVLNVSECLSLQHLSQFKVLSLRNHLLTLLTMLTDDSSICWVADVEGRRHLRSSATASLIVPPVRRSTLGDRSFPVAAPRAWNSLPPVVRSPSSLITFRRELKTFLFHSSFVNQ